MLEKKIIYIVYICLLHLVYCIIDDITIDSSCLHKTDYHFNQNPPIENHHLRKALKEYELMHMESTNREDPVKAFERPYVKGDVKSKYVYVYAGSSGLGNRLLSIVSAFLLSLLTNRVLIIYSPHYDFREILCTPFPNSTWVLPHDVKIPAGKTIGKYSVTNAVTDFSTVDAEIIYIQDAEQYYLTDFFLNNHFIDRLQQLFPGRNVGTVLLKYLIHPTNDLWAEIVSTYEQHERGALTVGIQVRNPVLSAVSCLKCLPPLPSNTHIFVASLGNQVESLHKHNSEWKVTQKYAEGGEKHDKQQVYTALHDIFLLSMCDRIVISVRSTFGYLIMAFKGSLCPIAGNNLHTSGTDKDECSWPNSHEICNHVGYASMMQLNSSGKIYYRGDIHPAILTDPCVDYMSGVRLNTARKLK